MHVDMESMSIGSMAVGERSMIINFVIKRFFDPHFRRRSPFHSALISENETKARNHRVGQRFYCVEPIFAIFHISQDIFILKRSRKEKLNSAFFLINNHVESCLFFFSSSFQYLLHVLILCSALFLFFPRSRLKNNLFMRLFDWTMGKL